MANLIEPLSRRRDEFLRCLAVSEKARSLPKPIFGYLSALLIHGLELPRECNLSTNTVHVICSVPGRRSAIAGAAYHTTSAPISFEEEKQDGEILTVTDPVTTCIHMAAHCSKVETTVLFDQLMRRDNPERDFNYRALENALINSAPFKGKTTAMWALKHCKPLTDSSMETRLRLTLTSARLPEPAVNLLCTDPETGEVWFADLCYPDQGLVLEYQGVEWHKTPDQVERDAHKLNFFHHYGCKVIQVTVPDLIEPARRERLISDVRRYLKEQSRLPNSSKASFADIFQH
jgi:hypothetical protein